MLLPHSFVQNLHRPCNTTESLHMFFSIPKRIPGFYQIERSKLLKLITALLHHFKSSRQLPLLHRSPQSCPCRPLEIDAAVPGHVQITEDSWDAFTNPDGKFYWIQKRISQQTTCFCQSDSVTWDKHPQLLQDHKSFLAAEPAWRPCRLWPERKTCPVKIPLTLDRAECWSCFHQT